MSTKSVLTLFSSQLSPGAEDFLNCSPWVRDWEGKDGKSDYGKSDEQRGKHNQRLKYHLSCIVHPDDVEQFIALVSARGGQGAEQSVTIRMARFLDAHTPQQEDSSSSTVTSEPAAKWNGQKMRHSTEHAAFEFAQNPLDQFDPLLEFEHPCVSSSLPDAPVASSAESEHDSNNAAPNTKACFEFVPLNFQVTPLSLSSNSFLLYGLLPSNTSQGYQDVDPTKDELRATIKHLQDIEHRTKRDRKSVV